MFVIVSHLLAAALGAAVVALLLLPVIDRLATNPAFGGILTKAGLAEAIRALPTGLYDVIVLDGDDFKAWNTVGPRLLPGAHPFTFTDTLVRSLLDPLRGRRHAGLWSVWFARLRLRPGEQFIVGQNESGDEFTVIMPAGAGRRVARELEQLVALTDRRITPQARRWAVEAAATTHGAFSVTGALVTSVSDVSAAITAGYVLVAARKAACDRGTIMPLDPVPVPVLVERAA